MASDDDGDEDDVEGVNDDDDDDDDEAYNVDVGEDSDVDDDGENDDNELNESKDEVHNDGEGNQKTLWIIPCKFLFFLVMQHIFLRFKFLLLWLLGMG